MKKILFITTIIDSGGVAKSLVNTLNAIDYNKIEVDLLLLSGKCGVYTKFIPKNVNIITDEMAMNAMSGIKGVFKYLLSFKFNLSLILLCRLFFSLFSKSYSAWLLSRLFPKLNKEYDLIVDYNGQHQLYYMVDRLNSKKKVTFFHSDYNMWSYYKSMDKKYYPKVDVIFTISPLCVNSLIENFPDLEDKIKLFENISSPDVIFSMAEETIDDICPHGIILMTLASVWYNKGIDLAIEASVILKNKGLDFTWIFVGKIAENKWVDVVNDRELEQYIFFLGIKANPYPYLKQCDIYVHPSRFEGKSIALDEAKILCKPIVVTNFSTVNDQFIDGVNATICEMNGESLANAIIDIIYDRQKRDRYINYLKNHVVDNSHEVEKLYNLINR